MNGRDFKLGLKMIKYGLQYKAILVMMIVFTALGTVYEVLGTMGAMSGVYFVIAGAMISQMIISSTVSSYVAASPEAQKLRGIIPCVITCIVLFIEYTYFIVLRFVVTGAWNHLGDTSFAVANFSGALVVGALAFFIQLYDVFSSKCFIPAMILMIVTEVPLISFSDRFIRFVPELPNLWLYIAGGYVIIIVGCVVGILCARLMRKKNLDPRAYRSALKNAGR